ncbi:MAG: FadR family transcriptional regulator [Proteobacteria bacterium]|nr:FadR family transcriptional regulator [Pseudomonadota bacterium]
MSISPLSDSAYERLLALINERGLHPHDRLPGEVELAVHCGVSRPVMRQALARARTEGRVYARHGVGNFVGEPPPLEKTMFGALHSIPDVRAFLDFRCLLEGESAARAARCKDPELRAAIAAKRRQQEAAMASGEPSIEEDIEFHRAIALASGNRFFVMTMAALEEQTRFAVKLIRELSPQPQHTRWRDIREEHRRIDAAIAKGDPSAARQAMTDHLRGGMTRLFGRESSDEHEA